MRRRHEEIFSNPPQAGDLEPFRLGSGDQGVLLIHGFCGTPPEMRGLGEHLAASGFRVHGVLLKGHGTTPEDLATTTRRDWVASADAQLAELRRECSEVFVSGQSMGGAISLVLAARHPDLSPLPRFQPWSTWAAPPSCRSASAVTCCAGTIPTATTSTSGTRRRSNSCAATTGGR